MARATAAPPCNGELFLGSERIATEKERMLQENWRLCGSNVTEYGSVKCTHKDLPGFWGETRESPDADIECG